MSTPTALPAAAIAVLPDLAHTPEPVRHAIGGQLLTALGITEPATTDCLGCGTTIPAREVWCSWLCRNLDDRHDD